MRLLFFLHSLSGGGAERVTVTLANHWAARGWEVAVVTITDEARDFYELHSAIRRVPLRLETDSRSALEGLGNNWRRIRALRSVLKRERPDVAVAMMATANALLAVASMGTGVPAIGSERTFPPRMPMGRLWERVRRYTYGRLGGVVAQTEPTAQWLAEYTAARRERITIIPNPVSLPLGAGGPRLAPSKVCEGMACSHILLAVGRLGQEKGFDRLIDAFGKVAGRHRDWGLIILGEGEERERMEKQCRERDLDERIRLPGSAGNVGEWYAAADLYVLTSRFEGFPNTLLEAVAHGLPAVAVNCETGPREILRHEVDGLLVPPDDEASLVEALERLMSDAALRSRFGQRAVEARERFSVQKVVGEWERLFEGVCGGKGKEA